MHIAANSTTRRLAADANGDVRTGVKRWVAIMVSMRSEVFIHLYIRKSARFSGRIAAEELTRLASRRRSSLPPFLVVDVDRRAALYADSTGRVPLQAIASRHAADLTAFLIVNVNGRSSLNCASNGHFVVSFQFDFAAVMCAAK